MCRALCCEQDTRGGVPALKGLMFSSGDQLTHKQAEESCGLRLVLPRREQPALTGTGRKTWRGRWHGAESERKRQTLKVRTGIPGVRRGCPDAARDVRGTAEAAVMRMRQDRQGGLHSPAGLWARAWAGCLVKQKARSPNARGFPSCRLASFGRNHRLISLGVGRKPPPSWG